MENRGTILENFSPEFIEKANYNPIARAIIETLSREDNPYSLIEQLVEDREKLAKNFEEYILSNPPRYVLKNE
jgi:hypothetical protein